MGQGESREKYEAPLRELEGIVLQNVATVIEEVHSKNELDKHWIAERLNFSEIISSRIFPAFYTSENEGLNVKALLSGLILCLNGNVKEKCDLLYTIFELDDSHGVSKDELQAVLLGSCEAAFKILSGLIESPSNVEDLPNFISRVVDQAFSQAVLEDGKLNIKNFDDWCQTSQDVMDTVLGQQCQLSLDEVNIALSMENLVMQTDETLPETTEQSDTDHLPESDQEIRLASDLFKNVPATCSDIEGHSFFDTLSSQDTSQNFAAEPKQVDDNSFQIQTGQPDISQKAQPEIYNPLVQNPLMQHPPYHVPLYQPPLAIENFPSAIPQPQTTAPHHPLQDLSFHMHPSHQLPTIQDFPGTVPQSQIFVPQDPMQQHSYYAPPHQPSSVVQDFAGVISQQQIVSVQSQDPLIPQLPHQSYQMPSQQPPSAVQNIPSAFPPQSTTPFQDPLQIEPSSLILDDKSVGAPLQGVTVQAQGPIHVLSATQAFSQSSTDLDESGFLEMEPPVYDQLPVVTPTSPTPQQNIHPPQTLAFQQPHEVVQQPPLSPLPEDILDDKQTDADRHRCAWIPADQSKVVLAAVMAGQVNTADIDQKYLTSPGIVIEGPQGDPVKDLLLKHFGEESASIRKTLTVESVSFDESGLRQLLAAQCWHAALDFTSQFLTAHGQGVGQLGQRALHTHKTLQIWFCRIALLFKLHMYGTAEAELDPFGNLDKPDLFYEFYQDTYPSRKGCMVPFSMRILHAELPQYTGRADEALDRMYYLQRICQQVLKNLKKGLQEDGTEAEITEEYKQASEKLWLARELRLLYSIGNCFAVIKDYYSAVSIFQSILKRDTSNKSALLSGIGRLYIHLGNVEKAQEFFKQLDDFGTENAEIKSLVVMNKGLVSLGSGQYEEAYKHFVTAAELDPTNAVAVNNEAVCLLFLGKLREALALLEEMLERDPVRTIQEGVVFNLCTIYELESSQSLHKKQQLLELIALHKGDGFNIANLRMG